MRLPECIKIGNYFLLVSINILSCKYDTRCTSKQIFSCRIMAKIVSNVWYSLKHRYMCNLKDHKVHLDETSPCVSHDYNHIILNWISWIHCSPTQWNRKIYHFLCNIKWKFPYQYRSHKEIFCCYMYISQLGISISPI